MLITFLIFFATIFVLVIAHELGHFFSARLFGIRVDEFGFGIPPRIAGIRRGGTLYSINWLPVGGFVKIFGEESGFASDPRAFGSKSALIRSAVLLSGIFANLLFAWILLSVMAFVGILVSVDENEVSQYTDVRLTIIDVAPGSPAAKVELRAGDVIEEVAVGIYGTSYLNVQTLQEFARTHAGEFISASVKRNGQKFNVLLESRVSPPSGEGPLGIAIDMFRVKKSSWYQAPIEGARTGWSVSKLTVVGIFDTFMEILRGRADEVQISGPVGIFFLTERMSGAGFASLLFFIAVLSISLALFNVLPIPGLDGGRFLFLLIEIFTGRKISERISSVIHSIGLIVLLILIAFITRLDIQRYF